MSKSRYCVAVVVFFMLCIPACFGQFTATERYDLRASIPQQTGFSLAISRIQGNTWTTTTGVEFGQLVFDDTFDIFKSDYYFAVDIGVMANLANWSVRHTRTSFARVGGGANLDSNVNVVFVKQIDRVQSQQLEKVSYLNSNNKVYTKAQLNGGWLRIYYGLATGDANSDAPGTTPIGVDKATGTYQGQVTLTLSETL